MFNPLVNLDNLSDLELEEKISQLSRKYFQTRNPQVQMQISSVLEMHKEELKSRQARQKLEQQEQQENGDSDLDNLINVS